MSTSILCSIGFILGNYLWKKVKKQKYYDCEFGVRSVGLLLGLARQQNL